MARVKICGITNWADAKLAVDLGAQMLGFNFHGPSPRFISLSAARRMIKRLPKGIDAVGVFVSEDPDLVDDMAHIAALDFVQLHGNESPREVTFLSAAYGVIKAFRVEPGFRVSRLARYSDAAAFLLDGFHPRLRGGTGRTFDWSIAVKAKKYGPIFLAGGLTPENIGEAIHAVQPYAVDVCSGTEARPGKKDPARLRALMRAAEGANRKIARDKGEIG